MGNPAGREGQPLGGNPVVRVLLPFAGAYVLWAGPWLRDVAGFGRDAVALHLLLMAVATTAGFLFWGNFATWSARRGIWER